MVFVSGNVVPELTKFMISVQLVRLPEVSIRQHADHPKKAAAGGTREFVVVLGLRRTLEGSEPTHVGCYEAKPVPPRNARQESADSVAGRGGVGARIYTLMN